MAISQQARKKRRERLRQGLVLAVLCVGGVSMVLPLVWMVSTSLKDPGSIYTYPPEFIPRRQVTTVDAQTGQAMPVYTAQIGGKMEQVVVLRTVLGANVVRVLGTGQEVQIPLEGPSAQRLRPVRRVHIQWSNYPEAWRSLKLESNWMSFEVPAYRFRLFGMTFQTRPWRSQGIRVESAFLAFYLNSILVAGLATLGQVFTSSLAAFAFARLRFRGRDALFLGYLGTLMVPFVVTMIPVFALFNVIRLYDTYAALILPAMFSAYGTFMLRQFFVTIPHELEDAARIDGCGHWGVYRHVVLPLSKPALATLTTFTFLYSWNNFMWPLIMIDSDQRKPLMLGLHTFMGRYSTDWTLLMAASVMVMVPVLLVFIFGQRYFVKGIQMTGLKG